VLKDNKSIFFLFLRFRKLLLLFTKKKILGFLNKFEFLKKKVKEEFENKLKIKLKNIDFL
jgi:hypothetical protein